MDIHWVRVPMIEPTWKFTTGIKERRLKPRSCNNVCCDFRSWVYLVYSLVEACFWGRTWTSESFILSHWSIVSIVSKDATAETSMILHGLCGPCFGNSNYLEQCCFSAWLVRSALDCLELTEHANGRHNEVLVGCHCLFETLLINRLVVSESLSTLHVFRHKVIMGFMYIACTVIWSSTWRKSAAL